jgi:16S rRNA (guanine527-N7)-methyltransferase
VEQRDPAALAPALRDRLQIFTSLLVRWNPTIRLVSTQDIAHLWTRHVEDALQLVPLIPPATAGAVDLGSGGGLPGLVLAIATGLHFDLIEADSRKAAFLHEAAIATKAPATIHARRIEHMALPPRRLVTARALAPLPRLLALAKPFLADGGICLFPKGERVETEIAEAEQHWSFSLERLPSHTDPAAGILRIAHLMPRPGAPA